MFVQEVDKLAMKVLIPTGDDTYSFRSAPDAATVNIVKNICNRQWKPVVNAMFLHKELREELLWSLAKHLAHEMTAYTNKTLDISSHFQSLLAESQGHQRLREVIAKL